MYNMKFLETHFEEYIHTSQLTNLHPKLDKIFVRFPNNIHDFKNIIFYGPSGVGKYTQLLKSIKKYSPSELKYEKKISILFNKQSFYFKISDIHYEIDMSLLGCNSKLLWHEIYQQIVDIISAKTDKCGIIVCKYFHDIHSELLENFYSYMQQTNSSIHIKFILLTEELSFIPDNILNCCETISIARPLRNTYSRCINKKIPNKFSLENIQNIKNLQLSSIETLACPHKFICDKIINEILNTNINFVKFRDLLYDIFIYNLNITHCIWYITQQLINQNKIQPKYLSPLLIKIYHFFQYYNNNYRPIYHLESYLFYLINIIHEYKY